MIKKADYNTKIQRLKIRYCLAASTGLSTKATKIEYKIPDTNELIGQTDFNTKNAEFVNKIPDASDFDTKLRSTKTKVTLNKTRKVHTETKLKEGITSVKTWLMI